MLRVHRPFLTPSPPTPETEIHPQRDDSDNGSPWESPPGGSTFRLLNTAARRGGFFNPNGPIPMGTDVARLMENGYFRSSFERRAVDAGHGITLSLRDTHPKDGKGRPTVVFFHGLMCSSDVLFCAEINALMQQSPNTRLIAIDFPAHGGSTIPPLKNTRPLGKEYGGKTDFYDLNVTSTMMLQALRTVGVEEYIAVGLSMGYIVPMHVINQGITNPKMRAMVCQSTTWQQPGILLGAMGQRPALRFLELMENKVDSRALFYGLMMACGYGNSEAVANHLLSQLDARKDGDARLRGWLEYMGHLNQYVTLGQGMLLPQNVARFRNTPLILLAGEQDRISSPRVIEKEAKALAKSGYANVHYGLLADTAHARLADMRDPKLVDTVVHLAQNWEEARGEESDSPNFDEGSLDDADPLDFTEQGLQHMQTRMPGQARPTFLRRG